MVGSFRSIHRSRKPVRFRAKRSDPGFRCLLELLDGERLQEEGKVGRARDGIHLEGVGEGILSDLGDVENRGELHIRDDAVVLGRESVDTIECLNRELESALLVRLAVEGEDEAIGEDGAKLLDRSLSECRLVSHDDGAVVILQGGGKNLGSRGAGPIGQYDERASVDRLAVAGRLLVTLSPPID